MVSTHSFREQMCQEYPVYAYFPLSSHVRGRWMAEMDKIYEIIYHVENCMSMLLSPILPISSSKNTVEKIFHPTWMKCIFSTWAYSWKVSQKFSLDTPFSPQENDIPERLKIAQILLHFYHFFFQDSTLSWLFVREKSNKKCDACIWPKCYSSDFSILLVIWFLRKKIVSTKWLEFNLLIYFRE